MSAGYMNTITTIGDKQFLQRDLFYADSSFFDLFSYQLLEGDRSTALKELNSIVITEEVAISYFGRTDVLGEMVKLKNAWEEATYKVTGVAASLPDNTHLKFQALTSFENMIKASGGSAVYFFWLECLSYLFEIKGWH